MTDERITLVITDDHELCQRMLKAADALWAIAKDEGCDACKRAAESYRKVRVQWSMPDETELR